MKIFILVMLIVFAIPLFAVPVWGSNTVDEYLSNSIVREEVSFTEQELFDNNIAVLAVGARDLYQFEIAESKQSVLFGKTETVGGTYNVDHSRRLNTEYTGGGSRIFFGIH